jgi:hypothetical protein
MRYRLRTLLILLAVGPIFLAASYWTAKDWQRRQREAAARTATSRAIVMDVIWPIYESDIESVTREADREQTKQEGKPPSPRH